MQELSYNQLNKIDSANSATEGIDLFPGNPQPLPSPCAVEEVRLVLDLMKYRVLQHVQWIPLRRYLGGELNLKLERNLFSSDKDDPLASQGYLFSMATRATTHEDLDVQAWEWEPRCQISMILYKHGPPIAQLLHTWSSFDFPKFHNLHLQVPESFWVISLVTALQEKAVNRSSWKQSTFQRAFLWCQIRTTLNLTTPTALVTFVNLSLALMWSCTAVTLELVWRVRSRVEMSLNIGAESGGQVRVAKVLYSLCFMVEMKSLGSETILDLAVLRVTVGDLCGKRRVRSGERSIFWLEGQKIICSLSLHSVSFDSSQIRRDMFVSMQPIQVQEDVTFS